MEASRRLSTTAAAGAGAPAAALLGLLWATDLALCALHSVSVLRHWEQPLLRIDLDRSYAEAFQYLKWLWVALLCAATARRSRTPAYLAWSAVFAYALADDSLRLHETYGEVIARWLAIPPPFTQDAGEALFSGGVGMLLLPLLAWAWLRGGAAFRRASLDLLLLFGALAFFAIGVDLVHGSFMRNYYLDHLFSMIEDGGEMLVGSLLVWQAHALWLHGGAPPATLRGRLREAWLRRRRR